jgi:hypothetical protein
MAGLIGEEPIIMKDNPLLHIVTCVIGCLKTAESFKFVMYRQHGAEPSTSELDMELSQLGTEATDEERAAAIRRVRNRSGCTHLLGLLFGQIISLAEQEGPTKEIHIFSMRESVNAVLSLACYLSVLQSVLLSWCIVYLPSELSKNIATDLTLHQ